LSPVGRGGVPRLTQSGACRGTNLGLLPFSCCLLTGGWEPTAVGRGGFAAPASKPGSPPAPRGDREDVSEMSAGAADRDTGLRRVSKMTRWLVAGSIAAAGVLSAVVAQALPGSSGSAATPSPGPGTVGAAPATP